MTEHAPIQLQEISNIMMSAEPKTRVTRRMGQLLAVCCGFISGRPRIHLRPPEGCLDDSEVFPTALCKWLVNVYHRVCPHSSPGSIKHDDVSSIQNPRNRTSGAAAGRGVRLHFGSSQDTHKAPEGCLDDQRISNTMA